MDEETMCDLEVASILKKQYKNDLIKNFLINLINKKKQDNNNYSNLQLLADVSFYYEKIKNTINIANNTLEMINDTLEINHWNNSEINNFLNSNLRKVENKLIAKIIDSEKINNLTNNNLANNKYPKQQILI